MRSKASKTETMNDEQIALCLLAASRCENRVIGAVLVFNVLEGIGEQS